MVKKMSMEINQIIELWRGLSPRLAQAIADDELLKGAYIGERNHDEDREDRIVDPVENHHEEDDV